MAAKISPALLAAIFTIAGPAGFAVAQDSAAPAAEPAAPVAQAEEAAKNAATAAQKAADAVTEAAQEAGKSAEATKSATNGAAATDAKPAAPATPQAQADAPATAPAAATAPAEDGEPQPGTYYAKETFGDWTLRCIKTPDGNDPCELYQLMKDDQGTAVAEATLIPLLGGGKAVAGATLVAPLETDLLHGIAMQVDSGKKRGYPFNFCAQVGCVSRMGFTAEELGQLKRGNKATVSLLPYGAAESEMFNLNLSLTGFTAGFDALTKIATDLQATAEAAQKADAPKADDAKTGN